MQETDWRKTLEVVVKGLVGAVLALAGLWLLGWLLSFLGALLLGIAGIIGALLRFLIPVAAIAGLVYYLVAQVRPKDPIYSTPARDPEVTPTVDSSPVASASPAVTVATTAHEEAVSPALESLATEVGDPTPSPEATSPEVAPDASAPNTEEPSADSSQPRKSRRKTN